MTAKKKIYHSFTSQLLHWHQTENQRTLVWKNEKDPYKIWLSEVILQQTRAEQGLPYYLKFIGQYPNVSDLANAPFEEVIKLWQGLGYYSRCANLYKTARIVSDEYEGMFPDQYEQIIALPGIGPYTAAAIASFAFQLPYPVVDGNVYRILSRYFGIHEPVDSSEGKKLIAQQALLLIDKENAGLYNQAIMDLGATICKPQNPLCDSCPVSINCIAFKEDLQKILPIKIKKIKIKQRFLHYFILKWKGHIYMEKREQKDIWQHLYQPYLIEKEGEESTIPLGVKDLPGWMTRGEVTYLGQEAQKLTHQKVNTYWYVYELENIKDTNLEKSRFFSQKTIEKLALPKSIFSFMSKNNYF